MSWEAAKTACDLVTTNKVQTLEGAAEELHSRGLTSRILHPTTVAKHAKAYAKATGPLLRCYTGPPPKGISKANNEKRVQWATANKRRVWYIFMFTDRSRFYLTHPGVSVSPSCWAREGQRPGVLSVNHPLRVNLYMGIMKYGVTKPYFVTGTNGQQSTFSNKKGQMSRNISTEEYKSVLTSGLLKDGNKYFHDRSVDNWVLQQDNDPAHKQAVNVVEEWREGKMTTPTVLPNWPPNSPDLNPIENVWGYVKGKVAIQGIHNIQSFKKSVTMELQNIPKKTLRNLFNSVDKRIHYCIKEGGEAEVLSGLHWSGFFPGVLIGVQPKIAVHVVPRGI